MRLLPPRTAVVVGAVALALSGCSALPASSDEPAATASPSRPIQLSSNVTPDQPVPVDTLVSVTAVDGTIDDVALSSPDGDVEGKVVDGVWTANERLEPGLRYALKASGTGEDGKTQRLAQTFSTAALTLDEQTYPSVAPLAGETVGVGMPVIVKFDLPVKDRTTFEQHMTVTAAPQVEGSWSWFNDREAHFRPREYWPAGAKVHVKLDLNSVPAGDGIYGQQDQDLTFKIGPRNVSVVDMKKHTLTYTRDGKTLKTLKVSTGDSSHQTRSGTKVIMEKFASVDMDAATTGVDSDDPGYYNMKGVKWAMRVTNSGEFLHAAPWNAAYFGRANMSHGCVGMTTADAGWIYRQSRRGDVVQFTGGTRDLEDRNGWTDWNVPWDEWVAGSALPPAPTTPTPTATTSAPSA